MAAATCTIKRPRGALLLAVGLAAVTFGYGALLARSVLIDSTTTVNAASQSLHNAEVRALLIEQTRDAVMTQLIGSTGVRDLAAFGVDVQRDLMPVVARLVDSPEFALAFTDAARAVHRDVFVDHTSAPVIDVTALVARARTEAIAVNNAYGELIAPNATLQVQLPVGALPDLTLVNRVASPSLALAAFTFGALCAGLGVGVGADRRRDVRRCGLWLVTIATVQLLSCAVLYELLTRWSGAAAPIVHAAAATLVAPLVMAASGPLVFGTIALAVARHLPQPIAGPFAAEGRAAFLTDALGAPAEWRFDAAFEPEVLRTAPSTLTYQR